MGGSTTVSPPQPTQAETDLQNQQTALLKQQTAIIQSQYQTQNLLAPFLYQSLGLTPQTNSAGAITGFTQDPAYSALQKQQNTITSEFLDRTQQALEGNLPIDPGLTTSLNEQESKLQQTLAQQLGPNWATSTPGTTAMNQWNLYRSNAEESARRGDLTMAESLALGNQQGANANTSSFLQNAGGVSSLPFGSAQALGANAQGYNNPISFLENIRNQQFQASIFNAQQNQGLFGGLGSALGSIVGLGVGGLAGNTSLFSSSRFLKRDEGEVAEDKILEAITKMPVRKWRYREETGLEPDMHIGPMAEDFNEGLGLEKKPVIHIVDALGAHHAAIKATNRRIDDLEESGFLRRAA